jgi:halimadienyl-diphosphate synthase
VTYFIEAQNLIGSLHQAMSPSPYDIAWMARVPGDEPDQARWPDLLDWLIEHQHPDGSWGSRITYFHDRIICTLAATIALHKYGPSPDAQVALKRAEQYLWRHLHRLPSDPFELVGFELLFPTLLATAQNLSLDVPTHTCGYGAIQNAKIRLIPPDLLYSPHITTVHSLEFLGRSGDAHKLHQALAPNGSLGNSPSATAYYFLMSPDDDRALSYLETMRAHLGHVMYLFPFELFELTWTLNNFAFTGRPLTEYAGPEVWEALQTAVGPQGLGLDPSFGIPDGDCTSVGLRLLQSAGCDVDPLILKRFEDPRTHVFKTYDYERNLSVGTNVHALEALHLLHDYPGRRVAQENVLLMLLDQRKFDLYWVDKWHASPYYATAHALVGLLQGDFHLFFFCRPTVDWILHTQRDDGSWGFFEEGTAEETAYALTALLHYHRYKARCSASVWCGSRIRIWNKD